MRRSCADLGICQARPEGCCGACNSPTPAADLDYDCWAELESIAREGMRLAAIAAVVMTVAGIVAVKFGPVLAGWLS